MTPGALYIYESIMIRYCYLTNMSVSEKAKKLA